MPYIGRTLGQGTRSRFLYTATAGQTTFSGADTQSNTLAYSDNNGVDCFQNGVLLKTSVDYQATTGTSVVLTTGASVNDVIEILVYDVFAIADHVKKSGDSMTGALTNIDVNGTELILDIDGDTSIEASTDDTMVFNTAGSERMRLDSSGVLRVSNTSGTLFNSSSATGTVAGTSLQVATSGSTVGFFNRLSSDGQILGFYKDGSQVGSIGIQSSGFTIDGESGHGGLRFGGADISPRDGGADADNAIQLGSSSFRFDDAFITNGVTTGSDQNEKQDIASATAKELNVAKKLSALFKTYKWKDAVAEKGDKARTHSGIIAQEVQSAFSAEGLDASNYGMFMSDTWWEKDSMIYETKEEAPKDAIEKTRLGVRYPELFSFIFSSIEARLTALEGKE